MAEISKRLAGAMDTAKDIRRGLESGNIVLREVQKLNADGSPKGEPSIALVGAVSGTIFAILVTKTMHPERTVTRQVQESSWNYFLSRYDYRTVTKTEKVAGGPKYKLLTPA